MIWQSGLLAQDLLYVGHPFHLPLRLYIVTNIDGLVMYKVFSTEFYPPCMLLHHCLMCTKSFITQLTVTACNFSTFDCRPKGISVHLTLTLRVSPHCLHVSCMEQEQKLLKFILVKFIYILSHCNEIRYCMVVSGRPGVWYNNRYIWYPVHSHYESIFS